MEEDQAEEEVRKQALKTSSHSILRSYEQAKRQNVCPRSDSGLPIDIWDSILCKFLAGVQYEDWKEIELVTKHICSAMLICKDVLLAGDIAFEKLGTLFDRTGSEKFDHFLKDLARHSLAELKSMSKAIKLKCSYPKAVLIANLLQFHGISRPSKVPARILMSFIGDKYHNAMYEAKHDRYGGCSKMG